MIWHHLETAVLLAQGAGNGGGGGGGFFGGDAFGLLPIVAIGFLAYFLLIRPEQQRSRDLEHMRESLKMNSRVVTAGGIVGTIANISKGSSEVTLKVDDNTGTKIRVLRSAISQVLDDKKSKDSDEKADKT